MIPREALHAAHADALIRWQAPFAGFTSGHDPRTTDNALLVLMYGGLEQAARHAWQNAGRRLIDKTYVDILWHVQQLTQMRTCPPERIAAALDDFIRETVAPAWEGHADMGSTGKADLAIRWVEDLAHCGFGSLHSELAASRLLFFLCPMLPVFNMSRGHLLALERFGYGVTDGRYRTFAATAGHAYRQWLPLLRTLPRPTPLFGDPAQQAVTQGLLDQSEWWERRVFDAIVQQAAAEGGVPVQSFGCDDAGRLTP